MPLTFFPPLFYTSYLVTLSLFGTKYKVGNDDDETHYSVCSLSLNVLKLIHCPLLLLN